MNCAVCATKGLDDPERRNGAGSFPPASGVTESPLYLLKLRMNDCSAYGVFTVFPREASLWVLPLSLSTEGKRTNSEFLVTMLQTSLLS